MIKLISGYTTVTTAAILISVQSGFAAMLTVFAKLDTNITARVVGYCLAGAVMILSIVDLVLLLSQLRQQKRKVPREWM